MYHLQELEIKNKTLKEMTNEKKVIGTQCTSFWGGLVLYELDDEFAKFAYDYGKGVSKMRTSKIRYSIRRGHYFMTDRRRVYLDEIMKVCEKQWRI